MDAFDLASSLRIGVISDTHGLLRPEVLTALAGVEYILHLGDVGDPAILATLSEIAPLTAIRGNIDLRGPCGSLPATEMLHLAGRTMYLIHAVGDLDLSPAAAQIDIVCFGHSHRPLVDWRGGVLYLNPGSCGPRRFDLPITIALLHLSNASINASIQELKPLSRSFG